MNSRNGDVLGIIHNSLFFRFAQVDPPELGPVVEDIHEWIVSLMYISVRTVEYQLVAYFASFQSGAQLVNDF
jgi:hypothetical protein